MKFLIVFTLLCFSLAATSAQEREGSGDGESVAQNSHLRTFYSEVDYRIAKTFISDYKTEVGLQQADAVRAINMHASVSAAIENAQFQDQYKVNGQYEGVRVYYGTKQGKKVAVIMPLDSGGDLKEPRETEKVYVVDMPERFADPCPPLCE